MACLALAACRGPASGAADGTSGEGDPATRSAVTIAYADPRSRAPGDRGIDIIVSLLSGEGLIAMSRDGRPLPRLAERWEVSPDGRTWHFTLRPHLTFQDGEALSGAAVRKAILPEPGTSESETLPGLRDLVAVDASSPREIVIQLKRPNAFLLEGVAQSPVSSSRDAGAGPYRIVSKAKGKITLGRFDGYYGGRPRLDAITMAEYASQREAWTAMLRGEVDALYDVSPEAFEFAKASPTTHVATFLRAYVTMLAFNVKHPTLGRRDVRRALNLAIDRRQVIETAGGGRGVRAADPIWPLLWARDATAPAYGVDRAAAAAMLDAAGLRRSAGGADAGTRFAFTCLVASDSRFERLALLVQRQLLSVDVDMRLEAVPFEEWVRRVSTGRFEASLGEIISGPGLGFVYMVWHSNPPSPFMRSGYSGANAVLDQLRAARTDDETRTAVRALQRTFYDDPPAAFLYWDQASRVVSRRFALPPGSEDQDILRSVDRWQLAGPEKP
jgi:peptide/nickel transport system substrate-binding protein